MKLFILCKNAYCIAIAIHMCQRIFAQDYINHFDKWNKESNNEINPVNLKEQEEDFVKEYEEQDKDCCCSMISKILEQ